MSTPENLIGIGLYSASEAARLTGVSRQRIHRWLRGYYHRRGDDRVWSDALWRPQASNLDEALNLGFRDLLELRVVKSLRDMGLGMATIRLAMARARDIIGEERPFSTNWFRTDGRTVFLELAKDGVDEPVLLDLVRRQFTFHRAIAPSFQNLEFEREAPVKWWPLSRNRQVVLDPKRGFGQPIVDEGGVPTAVLADAVKAEGSMKAAARVFEISEIAIRDALKFEKSIAA